MPYLYRSLSAKEPCKECLFPPKSAIIGGAIAERDLQLKAQGGVDSEDALSS